MHTVAYNATKVKKNRTYYVKLFGQQMGENSVFIRSSGQKNTFEVIFPRFLGVVCIKKVFSSSELSFGDRKCRFQDVMISAFS